MRRLRVVRVIQHLARGGGVQTRLTELLPVLAKDVDVRVLCYKKRGELADALEDFGIPVDLVVRGSKWSPANLRRYARYFRSAQPDVVHTHSYTANTMAIVAASLAGVPVRVRHLHTLIPWGREGWLRTRLRTWVDARAAGLADVTLAVSAAARERFLRGSGLPPESCRVLYNGIDLGRFTGSRDDARRCRRELGVPEGAPLIGIVGRLARGKGHHDFLRTAQLVLERCPQARFLVVGEGPLRADLEVLSRDLGVSAAVTFTGYRADVPVILESLDLFLLTSQAERGEVIPDGLPGVAIEAQAAGLPVVAFDLPMMSEIIPPDAGVGRLVATGDVGALAEAVLAYLAEDAARREAGERALRNARRFAVETCAENTLSLYRELLVGRRVGTGG